MNTLTLLCLLVSGHPLHLSVTEIEMKPQKNELHVVIRVFVDDFQTGIRSAQGNADLNFMHIEGTKLGDLAEDYLKGRFAITLDGEQHTWRYLGNEVEGDAFYLYILLEEVKSWKTIGVRNTVLTETFNDQSNIINVRYGEVTKSLRLTAKTPDGNIVFE